MVPPPPAIPPVIPPQDYAAQAAPQPATGLDEAKASRNLVNGLISLVVLILLAEVGGCSWRSLGFGNVGREIAHMDASWLVIAVWAGDPPRASDTSSPSSRSLSARRSASARAWR